VWCITRRVVWSQSDASFLSVLLMHYLIVCNLSVVHHSPCGPDALLPESRTFSAGAASLLTILRVMHDEYYESCIIEACKQLKVMHYFVHYIVW